MATGNHPLVITLNGSGAGSGTVNLHGELRAVRIVASSGTPTVVIAEAGGTQETIINAAYSATPAVDHPATLIQKTDGTDTTQYDYFYLAGAVTVTVTGGAAAGTVSLVFKLGL